MDWENLPEWIKLALAGALSSLGTLVIGVVRAKSDSKRVRVDDRGLFTSQILERLQVVEEQSLKERRACEEQMSQMDRMYRESLDARDKIISQQNARISHLESMFKEFHGDHSPDPRI